MASITRNFEFRLFWVLYKWVYLDRNYLRTKNRTWRDPKFCFQRQWYLLGVHIQVQTVLDSLQLLGVVVELQRLLTRPGAVQRLGPRIHGHGGHEPEATDRGLCIRNPLEAHVLVAVDASAVFSAHGAAASVHLQAGSLPRRLVHCGSDRGPRLDKDLTSPCPRVNCSLLLRAVYLAMQKHLRFLSRNTSGFENI